MQIVSGLPSQKHPPIGNLRIVSSWISPSSIIPPKVSTTILHECPDTDQISITRRTIYIQGEPEVIISQREFMIKNAHRFHSILTYDHIVLQICPNARKYLYGGCWIHPPDRDRANPLEKTFQVSTLVGWKAIGTGHILRQEIYKRQKEMQIPYTFFRSSHGTPIPEITINPIYKHPSKFELFRSFQFSLVIENSKQINYFTEKIIDCLITKTVPIYWGCPNIGDYFDVKGIIVLETETVEEFLQKVSELTPETYSHLLPVVEQNYKKALQYVSVEANINRALKNIPDY
jgi:hypothetical protein